MRTPDDEVRDRRSIGRRRYPSRRTDRSAPPRQLPLPNGGTVRLRSHGLLRQAVGPHSRPSGRGGGLSAERPPAIGDGSHAASPPMPKSPSASQKHSPQLARAPPARVRDGRPEGEDPRRGASASPRARFRKKTPHPSKDREACCALRRCGDERLRPPGQSPDQHATRRDIMHLLIPLIWWVERTWPTARFPGNTAMTPRRGKRAMSRSSAAETREAGASSSCLIWCRNLFAACLASCDADHTVGKASF